MKTLAALIATSALFVLSPVQGAPVDLWGDATSAYEVQHFARALALYEQLALDGDARAAELAGTMLFYGEALYGTHVPRDRIRAALLLQRAAQDGRPVAKFLLSKMASAPGLGQRAAVDSGKGK